MPLRLLIVDDSPAMHRVITRIVSNAGLSFECVYAGSGSEALDVVRRCPVDLILTDINMPVMNGEEFVATLHQDPALREIPVVVMSTDATRARISRLEAAGARGYLSKPFRPETLCHELARVLGSTHA